MKNSIFSRRAGLILAALFVIGFVFTSCIPTTQNVINEDVSIIGKWVASEYESYEITSTTFKSGYEGNNLVIAYTNDEETAGYIYIKYTKAIESTTTEPTGDDKATWTDWGNNYWSRYSTTAPDVGKWYAIAFKDLEANKVQISGAYGAKSSTASLEEAIAEFTIEKGYFGMYSACTKQ